MEKKTTVLILMLLLTSMMIKAQESKTRLSLEVDPATFVFKGYGVHIRVQPSTCQHLLFGVGMYAMDIPDVLVDMNEKNKGKDWSVRLNHGASGFVEHHFTEVNSKFFVGSQLGVQQYAIEKQDFQGSEKIYEWVINDLRWLHLQNTID